MVDIILGGWTGGEEELGKKLEVITYVCNLPQPDWEPTFLQRFASWCGPWAVIWWERWDWLTSEYQTREDSLRAPWERADAVLIWSGLEELEAQEWPLFILALALLGAFEFGRISAMGPLFFWALGASLVLFWGLWDLVLEDPTWGPMSKLWDSLVLRSGLGPKLAPRLLILGAWGVFYFTIWGVGPPGLTFPWPYPDWRNPS